VVRKNGDGKEGKILPSKREREKKLILNGKKFSHGGRNPPMEGREAP